MIKARQNYIIFVFIVRFLQKITRKILSFVFALQFSPRKCDEEHFLAHRMLNQFLSLKLRPQFLFEYYLQLTSFDFKPLQRPSKTCLKSLHSRFQGFFFAVVKKCFIFKFYEKLHELYKLYNLYKFMKYSCRQNNFL